MNKYSIIVFIISLLVSAYSTAETHTVKLPEVSSEFQNPKELQYQAPDESEIGKKYFGDMIKLGKAIFEKTPKLLPNYVGNGLNCGNCHLDSGRKAFSIPLWAAYPMYPAYRDKTKSIQDINMRNQDCFYYSMNGTPPPLGSHELQALQAYMYWLATNAPIGVELPGRGVLKLNPPPKKPSTTRGKTVYFEQCVQCHGDNGKGIKEKDRDVYVYPPLWGDDSYNWGAGMHRINTAAGFIKANMPLGKDYTLTDQQAWDVAAYMNSKPRPQDPRYAGDIDVTREEYHNHDCYYGKNLLGKTIGK